MRTLSLNIQCGETTCAEVAGTFCQFLVARCDGSSPQCALFRKALYDKDRDIRGWLLRCDECLKAEVKK